MREWSGDEVVGLGSRDVDIRDADQVREVVEKTRPDWIVLAAAYTNVDDCESHPDLAFAVNRDGRGKCGSGRQADRSEDSVSQFRLRVRWKENLAL